MLEIDGQMNMFELLLGVEEDVTDSWKAKCSLDEMLREALLRGTGFENGKERVFAIYQNKDLSAAERTKLLKQEFGIGASFWGCSVEEGLCGYDTMRGGYTIFWKENGIENQKKYSWNEVQKVVQELVMSGEYYLPTQEKKIA